MKILLADDDQDQLQLRCLLLAQNGYEAIAATSAGIALQEAKAQHPLCAVIDLKIPTEAAGLGLIRDLKTLDRSLRIFVLTGGDAKRINALPERKLIEEVLVKGSSTAHLLKKLNELAVAADPQLQRLRSKLDEEKVITVDVKAVPRASKSEVAGVTPEGALKVRVAAVPDKGKANEELRDTLAAWFKVPKSHVELIAGETSQRKIWRVTK